MLAVAALVVLSLMQTFVARVYEIPSGSMETTLHGCPGCVDDHVLVDRLTYRFGDPAPGDVVVFAPPPSWAGEVAPPGRSEVAVLRRLEDLAVRIGLAPPDEAVIKRVVAVGGQTVACCDRRNRVLVDGAPLDEPYVSYESDVYPPLQQRFGPVTVPAGQLWLMGDNRNDSRDSRYPGQGPVPVAEVIGKARLVILPLHRFKVVHGSGAWPRPSRPPAPGTS